MNNRLFVAACLIFSGLLSGCASEGPPRDINDPTNSLVFGYIDMDEAPRGVNTATFLQVAPPSDTPYWETDVNKGLFFQAHLPPGSYQLTSLSGSNTIYDFPRQGNETSVRIAKPGIYFVGSYKYKAVKTGLFEAPKFSIERVKTPTEADLLKQILGNEAIGKSAWGGKIRARLAQLKR